MGAVESEYSQTYVALTGTLVPHHKDFSPADNLAGF